MNNVSCGKCEHWTPLNPNDETAPEGKCSLDKDPGFYPFGYWPSTLRADKCGKSEPRHDQ